MQPGDPIHTASELMTEFVSRTGVSPWWRWGDADLALAVGLSVLAAASTASVTAMVLPWLFSTCNRDPAFGSGPLATVVQDLLSIAIYFLVTMAVID